jgi:hypothetical protein
MSVKRIPLAGFCITSSACSRMTNDVMTSSSFERGLTINKVSHLQGFRHLRPAPCIVRYATPRSTGSSGNGYVDRRGLQPANYTWCTTRPLHHLRHHDTGHSGWSCVVPRCLVSLHNAIPRCHSRRRGPSGILLKERFRTSRDDEQTGRYEVSDRLCVGRMTLKVLPCP